MLFPVILNTYNKEQENIILGNKLLTLGYLDHDHSTVVGTDDALDATAAVNYSLGQFSAGIQYKYHNEGSTTTSGASSEKPIEYKDTVRPLNVIC